VSREFFQQLEAQETGVSVSLEKLIGKLVFDEHGLIPVVAQDAVSHEVLMLAWMNKRALELTLTTHKVTYWSRSRQQLWTKGDTSGNTQTLVSMSIDCDGDTILCKINQIGAACHTQRRNCFYLSVEADAKTVVVNAS